MRQGIFTKRMETQNVLHLTHMGHVGELTYKPSGHHPYDLEPCQSQEVFWVIEPELSLVLYSHFCHGCDPKSEPNRMVQG